VTEGVKALKYTDEDEKLDFGSGVTRRCPVQKGTLPVPLACKSLILHALMACIPVYIAPNSIVIND
jgi:hypothetical protein